MVETISSLSAILLCAEFFFLGGSIFAHRESTKNVLRTIMLIFAVLAVAVAWK